MGELAIHLAAHDPTYEALVEKFVDHFLWIAAGMNGSGEDGMWDEEDGFYYDMLVLPDGRTTRLKVRSLVGLLPLCATTVIEQWQRARVPGVAALFQERMRQMPQLLNFIHPSGPGHYGVGERGILALLTPERLHRVLANCSMRRNFSAPTGSVPSPNTTNGSRIRSSWRARNTASRICRRSPTVGCSAATQTGAGRSGSR
jgi:hypothetical protein